MLDYPSIEAVAAIVREGSFERAAHTLHITPSAISQRVRGLEERLGVVLIVRGSPCVPTETGRTLCAHFDRVRLLEADLMPAIHLPILTEHTPITLKVAVNADSLATWFPLAASGLAKTSGLLMDISLEDEQHTAELLRSGQVMAAITADHKPVQGCKTYALGALKYVACASPDFMKRYFPKKPTASAFAKAPCLRFDRRDNLQARWAKETYGIDLAAPTHWVPSTHAFLDLTLAGLAWGLHPAQLAKPHIKAGRLIEISPGSSLDVPLYWAIMQLYAKPLHTVTGLIREAANISL